MAGHSLMRATVNVVTPQDYQSWLQSQQANSAPPIGAPPPNANQAGIPGAAPGSPAGGTSGGAGGANAGPSSTAPTLSPAAQAGKAVFTGSAGCGTCHTLAAAGTSGAVGPNLGTAVVPDSKKRGLPLKQFIMESIVKPNAYISPGFPPNTMPQTFSKTLTSAQIQDLVNFIASVTK